MHGWLPQVTMVPAGAGIRLSSERWDHIQRRHPEMAAHGPELLETLANPDKIVEGDSGALMVVGRLRSGPLAGKNVVVVFREVSRTDGFAITAYLAGRTRQGRRTVWPK